MNSLYTLPTRAVLGGREYPHRTAWQDIVKLLTLLEREDKPAPLRWQIGLFYFFLEEIPPEQTQAAMEYLAAFLTAGQPGKPGPKRFDWQLDAAAIIADVNGVSGREMRCEPVHWWTFLSLFHSIREGQLSTLVSIRDKLRRGQRLEGWEQEYFADHRDQVLLRTGDDPQKERLNALVNGWVGS